jgi:uncharacterized protein (TIGR00369 family)
MVAFKPRELAEGLNGFLGFHLTDWRDGFAEISVTLDERHRNRQGGVHGGTSAALLDAATGFCGIFEDDPAKRRGNATVSITINFTGRAKGERLICQATLTKAGRRIYFAAGEVHDEHDNLVATADAIYAYTDADAQRR